MALTNQVKGTTPQQFTPKTPGVGVEVVVETRPAPQVPQGFNGSIEKSPVVESINPDQLKERVNTIRNKEPRACVAAFKDLFKEVLFGVSDRLGVSGDMTENTIRFLTDFKFFEAPLVIGEEHSQQIGGAVQAALEMYITANSSMCSLVASLGVSQADLDLACLFLNVYMGDEYVLSGSFFKRNTKRIEYGTGKKSVLFIDKWYPLPMEVSLAVGLVDDSVSPQFLKSHPLVYLLKATREVAELTKEKTE